METDFLGKRFLSVGSTKCWFKKNKTKTVLSFQGTDRGAILVFTAPLGIFCFLTDISVHCYQIYKSKKEAHPGVEAGSLQADAPFGSVLHVWSFFGSDISPCVIGLVVAFFIPKFSDKVVICEESGS